MLLWIWLLAPWVFALLSLGLACVLTEILRLRTARNRGNDRDDVSVLTGGLTDEIDCLFGMYKQTVYEPVETLTDSDILKALHEVMCAVTEQALAQLRQGYVR